MSLRAYQQVVKAVEDPRQTEYRLFGQVTRALMEAQRNGNADPVARVDALDWNRRMWSVLGTDCAVEGNGLSESLRAQIVSLSIWVHRYTSQVIRGEDDIDALIEINKIIMEGLAPRHQAAAPQFNGETSLAG